mgnify:CR=1 FL=1
MKTTVADIKELIPSLTDDQASAALELVNDKIGDTTRRIYDNLEKDILEVTGKTKPDGEKSYKFLRNVLGEGVKSSKALEANKKKTAELQDQYNDLKGKVDAGDASGASAEKVAQLEKQLDEAKALTKDLEGQLTTKGEEWQSKFDQQQQESELTRVDATIDRAFGGVTFRDGLSDKVRGLVEKDAREMIRSMEREWVDGKLLFKDENGKVLRHPETSIPYTADDLILQSLTEAEAIAVNRSQGGAGSGSSDSGGEGGTEGGFRLSGERDQVTATENLKNHLTERGLAPGTIEFQTEMDKAYSEVIIPADLPTQVAE